MCRPRTCSDPTRSRVRRALGDPVLFRRLLAAKNVVLWVLITPLCCFVALLIGVANDNLLSTLITVVWIGIVPFGALGISNLIGIRFPYHPMPLRFRWEHRSPPARMIVRWLALAATPYVVFPAITAVLMAPTLILWGLLTPTGLSKNLHVTDFGWGVGVACVLAAAGWWGGHHAGYVLARRRSELAGRLPGRSGPGLSRRRVSGAGRPAGVRRSGRSARHRCRPDR